MANILYQKGGSSFYENAFNTQFTDIWKNTPFQAEIAEFSYHKSLSIFLQEGALAEEQRRLLLYNYCKTHFNTTEESSIINQIYNSLESDNEIVKSTVKLICQLYQNNPTRTIEGLNDEEFIDYINDSYLNASMKLLHENSMLNGKSLIRPYIVDGELQFEILTPDNYRIKTLIVDGISKREIWVAKSIRDEEGYYDTIFHVWTDEIYETFIDNVRVSSETNPYGFIPYIELNLAINTANPPTSLYELMKTQLDYNRARMSANNNMLLNGFASSVLINFGLEDANNIKFGAGKVWVKDLQSDEDMKPEVLYINPPTDYMDIASYSEDTVHDKLRRMNIPESAISGDAGLQSGVAMEIDRMGLMEYRKDSESIIRKFDKKLIQLIANLCNIELGTNYDNNYIQSIEYIETQFPTNDKEDYDLIKEQFNNGLITLQSYINSTTDVDNINSNEQALEYVQDNIEWKKKFEEGRQIA